MRFPVKVQIAVADSVGGDVEDWQSMIAGVLIGAGLDVRVTRGGNLAVVGHRETGGSIPADMFRDVGNSSHLEIVRAPDPPLLNKSGGSTSEGPWPLCAARVGCLVRVEVEGSYCRKHGGAGPW